MEPHLNLFRVFIASPGDLKEERKELWNVVEKINSIYAKETNWRIELLGWEDTLPGTGRPQDLINTDLDKADLFIGCVWQRWGSRSGNGAKTGFEEEFDRALARRSTTQCPEMWLFFKEVEPVRMADPGEQLQKVLAFRSREIELKRLLYKEFSTLQEWQELVADLLHRQMLRLLAKNQNGNAAQAPSTASEPPTATNMPDKGDVGSEKGENAKKEEAVSTLLALLSDVEKAIKREGLEFDGRTHLEPNAHARLLLFAAANFSDRLQPITLNSHEINSIYLHREKLNISSPERLLILRTVVTDTTLTKPGWSFVKEAPKLTIRLWLPWLVLYDRDKWTRAALIAQATKIKYPLSRGRNGSAIVDSLLNDNNVTIRSAILQHLTALGTKSDLSRVSQLLSDEDKNVRSLAERVIRIIHLRDNAELETKKSIERRDSFDPELLEIVRQNATSFANETLLAAYDFPNPGLKAVAAQELLKRNLVSKELGNRMCDEDAKGIRECGYLALVTKGEKIDVEKVKRALDDSLWPYPGSDQW
jgi:hypothetical protein